MPLELSKKNKKSTITIIASSVLFLLLLSLIVLLIVQPPSFQWFSFKSSSSQNTIPNNADEILFGGWR